MKKSIALHADVNDLKQAMRDVLKEASVATKDDLKRLATKDDLVNLPTIKEIEKTLESYPTKDDLKDALKPYATKDDLKLELAAMEKRQDAKYATKDDLTKAIEPVVVEIKKIRAEISVALGLKNQKVAFPD